VLITDVSTLRGGPAPRQTRTRKTSFCFMIRQEPEIARASLAGGEGTPFQQVESMVGPVPGSLGKADRYGTASSLAVSGERYVRTAGRSAYQTNHRSAGGEDLAHLRGPADGGVAGHLYEPAAACALQQNRLHAFGSVTA